MQPDPFAPLLDKLNDLMKQAERNASKSLDGPVDPKIIHELKRIKAAVNAFSSNVEKTLAPTLADSELKLKLFETSPEKLTNRERKLIEQYRDLGVNAFVLRAGLSRARRESEGFARQRQVGKNTKKSIQQRRRKFKGLDGKV